jgi:hypothetical protein
MRNRRAISSGDHHSSSHAVTWSASGPAMSFSAFGRLARIAALHYAVSTGICKRTRGDRDRTRILGDEDVDIHR